MGYTWLPGRFALLAGVEPYEVMQVLQAASRRWPRPVTGPGGLPMLGILGRTTAGRGLVVFLRHDTGLDWMIVGSRPMTTAESVEFEKWEAEQ